MKKLIQSHGVVELGFEPRIMTWLLMQYANQLLYFIRDNEFLWKNSSEWSDLDNKNNITIIISSGLFRFHWFSNHPLGWVGQETPMTLSIQLRPWPQLDSCLPLALLSHGLLDLTLIVPVNWQDSAAWPGLPVSDFTPWLTGLDPSPWHFYTLNPADPLVPLSFSINWD